MTDKIRVGIVGATVTQGGSGWGANAHVPALKALPHYQLKAVCTALDTKRGGRGLGGVLVRGAHRFQLVVGQSLQGGDVSVGAPAAAPLCHRRSHDAYPYLVRHRNLLVLPVSIERAPQRELIRSPR